MKVLSLMLRSNYPSCDILQILQIEPSLTFDSCWNFVELYSYKHTCTEVKNNLRDTQVNICATWKLHSLLHTYIKHIRHVFVCFFYILRLLEQRKLLKCEKMYFLSGKEKATSLFMSLISHLTFSSKVKLLQDGENVGVYKHQCIFTVLNLFFLLCSFVSNLIAQLCLAELIFNPRSLYM